MLAGCNRYLTASIRWLAAFVGVLLPAVALASGPRWTAGVNYFDASAKGTPLVWANGQISYYIDQGSLSTSASQSQVVSMLNNAASVWTSVPTAAVSITQGGTLGEDVSGHNVSANTPVGTGATMPSDVQPSATTKPVGVIMDEDGSVINAIFGQGASDPSNCTQNAVLSQVDNFAVTGSIAHGLIILNGLCATNGSQLTLMQYMLIRAWGHILGLDWSQVNDAPVEVDQATNLQLAGWPVMHPVEWACAGSNYACMPHPTTLRLDDIAGLNRLYPVTSSNESNFPGKTITASSTISVQGQLQFPSGQGMQGVNVVLTPLVNGVPQVQYSVSAVTGARFHGNAGNPVLGSTDPSGNTLNQFGSDDPTLEGFFDLSGVPLPSGVTTSNYQLTFEAVNKAFVNATFSGTEVNSPQFSLHSVGGYLVGQVSPSGTMPVLTLPQLSAGSAVTQTVVVENAATEDHTNDGTESAPQQVAPGGEWMGRLTGYGHTGWYNFAVAANRVFTVELQSLDETESPSELKAQPLIGLWSTGAALGTMPAAYTTEAFGGALTGLSVMSAQTSAGGAVRMAVADARGDGRPDYSYIGRVLYAASVFPPRLLVSGGSITIHGTGFRPNAEVLVNGAQATVTSVSPTEITAVAPAAQGITGLVPVEVYDPSTLGQASILDGLSYDAYGTDEISVVAAPSGNGVSEGVPVPFTVRVVAGDGVTPAANATVTYTVSTGAANLGCGAASCSVVTNGAGLATLLITPMSTQSTQVKAALVNGGSVQAVFAGTTASVMDAVTPALYVAIGATVTWQPTVIMLQGASPVSGGGVSWVGGSGATVNGSSSTTNSKGEASTTVTAGPLISGQTATLKACETSNPTVCAQFTVNAVHAETAVLSAVSGAGQVLAASGTPAPVVLAVADAAGQPLAGATVSFYEQLTAWQPPCPVGGRCSAPEVLQTATVTATSNAQGLVNLTPLSNPGVATNLDVAATTGQQALLQFTIQQHP